MTGGDHHLALFNREAYHARNLTCGSRFQAFEAPHARLSGIRPIGTVTGVLTAEGFDSGWSAPFGGPDFVREPETVGNVVSLVDDLMDWARLNQWPSVRIRCKPAFYSRNETALQFALLNAGFWVETCDLNHHIDLAVLETFADYIVSLKREARKALLRSHREPFAFFEAIGDEEWERAYDVLETNRARKGRQLLLSREYVLRMRDTFPGDVHMFTVVHGLKRCAAALVYRVLPQRFLVVYWGDDATDLPCSPMNHLAYKLVQWGLEQGALTIDLGRSSKDGVADAGLVQFKQSVGARQSLRLDLVWRP